MKIFSIIRATKWLWLIMTIVVLLFVGILLANSSAKLKCAGRTVSAVNRIMPDGAIFSILINGKPVYMEIDQTRDGKVNIISHFEDGIEKYATHTGSTNNTERIYREVLYYDTNGDKYSVIDLQQSGVFTQRLWISQEKVMGQIFVDNHWTSIVVRSRGPKVNGLRSAPEIRLSGKRF